jgi:hypothetical protein
MIRIETESGWILVEHPDHARLAWRFAERWGNAEFAAPEPRADILVGVRRHDDAWGARDGSPFLTRQGRPSAFSRELVGKYSAFEEIEIADYLAVRGRAAALVAAENRYAALIISMHTIDLLTAQADLSGLSAADRDLHARFIEDQRRTQAELIEGLAATPTHAAAVAPEPLRLAFQFLQACDSLSLTACVRFPRHIPLRHKHPRRDGALAEILCSPLGDDTYRLDPYPLDADRVVLGLPCRRLEAKEFGGLEAFRAAYAAAPVEELSVTLVR